jgi:hypothetical protein
MMDRISESRNLPQNGEILVAPGIEDLECFNSRRSFFDVVDNEDWVGALGLF